jgi:hypothetical protein
MHSPWIKIGIGGKIGYLGVNTLNTSWKTYFDAFNKKQIYGEWPSKSTFDECSNIFAPLFKISVGKNKNRVCLEYCYYLGDVNNQMLAMSLSRQLN